MKRLHVAFILFITVFPGLVALSAVADELKWMRLGRLEGSAGPEPYVNVIATHPTDGDLLFAGVLLTTDGADLVYRSDDGGETWQAAAGGLPDDLPPNTGVEDMVFDPEDPDVVFAAIHDHGVWRSDDDGETWQAFNGGTLAADEDVVALATTSGSPGVIYALSTEGVNLRDGDDDAWRASRRGLPLPAQVVYNDIAVDPGDPDGIYVATSPLGLYRTSNGGRRWRSANGDLPGGVQNVKGVAVHPSGEVFITLRGAGLFRSTDRGDNWILSQQGITFTTTLFGTVSAPLFDPIAPDVALAFNADGIFRSTDGGATWADFTRGLSLSAVVSAVAFQPTAPAKPLAGTAIHGLWALRAVPEEPVTRFVYFPMLHR